MRKMALKSVVGAWFVIALGIGASTGCSSSSSNGSSPGGGGGGSNANICPKIPAADIQALLTATSSVTEMDLDANLLECDSGGLQMQLQTDDTSKQLYLTAYGDGGGDTHAITGVGDEAYWYAVNSGSGVAQSVPTVAAHKGSATCYISNDNTVTSYTMPSTPKPAPFGIQESDADAWSQKAAKVCTDFFTAAGI
jgi:hypothetical protein